MVRAYKLAKGWAIFIYIVAPLIIALFSWILIMPFVPGVDVNSTAYWLLIPMSLFMIAMAIIWLMEAFEGKFVIEIDRIVLVSIYSTKQLMFNEIKGYRVVKNYILIEANSETKEKIKISTYFEKSDEIMEWFSNNYADLDLVQADQEKMEILSNQDFGWTIEQRKDRLRQAQITAKIINWTGGLIGAWTLFLPDYYEYAIIIAIVFPVVCVTVLKYFNGLIRIDERNDTAYPTIFCALFAPSIAVCLRGLLDYQIFDYSKIWTPSILITLAFIAALTVGNKEFKFNKARDYLTVIAFAVIMFGYSYGTVITLNGMYDQSEPEIFPATILNKDFSSGKKTTYYFKLTPWGPMTEIAEVKVIPDLYYKLDEGDTVNVYFMKGQFDIPWFEVTK